MTQAIDLVVSTIMNAIATAPGNGPGARFGKAVGSQLLGNTKIISALLPKTRSWFLLNTDTQDLVYGPYEAQNVTENVGSVYADSFSLGNHKAVRQFVHGEIDSLTFQARFYSIFALLEIEKYVNKVKAWSKKDDELGRPPICYFWIGLDQHAKMESCIVRSVQQVNDAPGFLGSMKGATLQVRLERYDPFSLDDVQTFDTRYHFAKVGDTFDMLAASEYGDPMLGVWLAQQHPKSMVLEPGDIVKLPARSGSVRNAKNEPSSIAFKNLSRKKDTPQRRNLQKARTARSGPTLRYTTT